MADPETDLPPCGVYRTTQPIGEVPAGRLVYFHNHGDPGPGIYTPHDWKGNKARFHERGHTLTSPDEAKSLIPLAAEGGKTVVNLTAAFENGKCYSALGNAEEARKAFRDVAEQFKGTKWAELAGERLRQ